MAELCPPEPVVFTNIMIMNLLNSIGSIPQKEKEISGEKSSGNFAIIGYNRIGKSFYSRYMSNNNGNRNIIGFITLNNSSEKIDATEYPVLGEIKDIRSIIKEHEIKNAILAVDPQDYPNLHELIRICKRERIAFWLLSDFCDVNFDHSLSHLFKSMTFSFEFTPRRLLDIIVSLLIFIWILPLWLLITVLVKYESPGPVLCSKEKVGKNGRVFRMLKFRSVPLNGKSDVKLADLSVPRLTRIGKFLKMTHLDELPKLINVFFGDMSFIGPRPENVYYYEKYEKEIPFYSNRFKVKPGLTGLAQVETAFDDRVENIRQKLKYDLYYVDHSKSVLVNLRVILKAFWVLIKSKIS